MAKSQTACRLPSSAPGQPHLHLVAAPVLVVAAMQGLVHVADEMDDEFQRLLPLGQRQAAVGHAGGVAGDRVDGAVALRAVHRRHVAGGRDLGIDEMPGSGVAAGGADLVGPGRHLLQPGRGDQACAPRRGPRRSGSARPHSRRPGAPRSPRRRPARCRRRGWREGWPPPAATDGRAHDALPFLIQATVNRPRHAGSCANARGGSRAAVAGVTGRPPAMPRCRSCRRRSRDPGRMRNCSGPGLCCSAT